MGRSIRASCKYGLKLFGAKRLIQLSAGMSLAALSIVSRM
jgi:hypothetical protein